MPRIIFQIINNNQWSTYLVLRDFLSHNHLTLVFKLSERKFKDYYKFFAVFKMSINIISINLTINLFVTLILI